MRPRTALLMTLPPLMWAGNAVVGRLLVGHVPPLTLNLVRWVLAALLLAPLGWHVLRDARRIVVSWPYLLVIGSLGVGAYNALQYLALTTSTPLNVTLIAASGPLWMLAVGALAFGQPTAPRQMAGAVLSLAGVVLVVARGSWAALAQLQPVAGDIYILIAALAWAVYSWLLVRPPAWLRPPSRDTLQAWGWAGLLLVQILFGLLAAAAATAGEVALAHSASIDWRNDWVLAALLFVAIGPSILAYRCWGLGVALGGPALAAFFANLTPLFAALLSALLLGETPRGYHALAFALIVAGIAVSARRSS
ncbi:MAG: DMT family transporter [Burkholderiaceae bacterium]|nr:DMT family transporter [Burkholderiaceae bacterium]